MSLPMMPFRVEHAGGRSYVQYEAKQPIPGGVADVTYTLPDGEELTRRVVALLEIAHEACRDREQLRRQKELLEQKAVELQGEVEKLNQTVFALKQRGRKEPGTKPDPPRSE